MTHDQSLWIKQARYSIAEHERNITIAMDSHNWATVEKLQGYVDRLVRKIKQIEFDN